MTSVKVNDRTIDCLEPLHALGMLLMDVPAAPGAFKTASEPHLDGVITHPCEADLWRIAEESLRLQPNEAFLPLVIFQDGYGLRKSGECANAIGVYLCALGFSAEALLCQESMILLGHCSKGEEREFIDLACITPLADTYKSGIYVNHGPLKGKTLRPLVLYFKSDDPGSRDISGAIGGYLCSRTVPLSIASYSLPTHPAGLYLLSHDIDRLVNATKAWKLADKIFKDADKAAELAKLDNHPNKDFRVKQAESAKKLAKKRLTLTEIELKCCHICAKGPFLAPTFEPLDERLTSHYFDRFPLCELHLLSLGLWLSLFRDMADPECISEQFWKSVGLKDPDPEDPKSPKPRRDFCRKWARFVNTSIAERKQEGRFDGSYKLRAVYRTDGSQLNHLKGCEVADLVSVASIIFTKTPQEYEPFVEIICLSSAIQQLSKARVSTHASRNATDDLILLWQIKRAELFVDPVSTKVPEAKVALHMWGLFKNTPNLPPQEKAKLKAIAAELSMSLQSENASSSPNLLSRTSRLLPPPPLTLSSALYLQLTDHNLNPQSSWCLVRFWLRALCLSQAPAPVSLTTTSTKRSCMALPLPHLSNRSSRSLGTTIWPRCGANRDLRDHLSGTIYPRWTRPMCWIYRRFLKQTARRALHTDFRRSSATLKIVGIDLDTSPSGASFTSARPRQPFGAGLTLQKSRLPSLYINKRWKRKPTRSTSASS